MTPKTERLGRRWGKARLAASIGLLGALLSAPMGAAGKDCSIKVQVHNDGGTTAHVTKLAVKVKGGLLWRNIQQHGERILAPGQSYEETFSPTIATEACDANRRYRVKVVCKDSSGGFTLFPDAASKEWLYKPNETGWVTSRTVTIDSGCPPKS
jgi:hypothetical protein